MGTIKPARPLTPEEILARMERYCAYQDRCLREVRTKLQQYSLTPSQQEAILTRLTEERFVDQARFAQSFARGKHRLKQWGRLRIERELRARDIPEALITSALEEIEPQEYDRNFECLFLQRVEAVGGLSSTAQVAKVYRYLLARGYDPADIWEAINVKRSEKNGKP